MDVRDGRRLRDIVVDCARPAPLARFWATALHWPAPHWDEDDLAQLAAQGVTDPEDDPFVVVDSGDPVLPRIGFQRVPESKVGKNRVHLDVNVQGEDGVDELIDAGASVVDRFPSHAREHGWVMLRDPEGNEFCAILL